MMNSIAPLVLSVMVLSGRSYGHVIPRNEMIQDEATGVMYMVETGNGYQDFSGQFGDDELDMDIMVFSLITIIFIYICICLVYVAIRFVVKKILTRNARVTLLQDGDEVRRTRRTIEHLNARWPSALDDEEAVKDKLARLSPEEQFYYKQGEEYIRRNPPLIVPHALSSHDHVEDPVIDDATRQFINEEGAYAWEFQPDPNLPNDTILVENKTEVSFLNYNYEASVCTNLPIPRINRVYYCEFKIFELNAQGDGGHHLGEDETISFGLSTFPYPYFRLPGKHHHSVAYESSGARRFNDSFELEPELASLFPQLEKGDVVGIGYRSNSGTVFFTRNGKKLKEDAVGGHIKGWKFKYVYPIVGANIPCKIHVNFGTYGFVYIEANVKKWGYAKSSGMKLPPPSYEEYGQDTLLESGCEDEVSDNESVSSANDGDILDSQGQLLPPPPGFEFSTSPNSQGHLSREQITLHSLPMEPPRYSDEEQEGDPKIGKSRPSDSGADRPYGVPPLVEIDGELGDDEEVERDLDDLVNGDNSEDSGSEALEDQQNTQGNTVTNQFLQD